MIPWTPFSPWNSPYQNARVGILSLLHGIFPTLGSNPGLLHCRWILYQLSYKRSPKTAGVGSLSLLQQIFPTQELNRGFLHYRWILYKLNYQGSPKRSDGILKGGSGLLISFLCPLDITMDKMTTFSSWLCFFFFFPVFIQNLHLPLWVISADELILLMMEKISYLGIIFALELKNITNKQTQTPC